MNDANGKHTIQFELDMEFQRYGVILDLTHAMRLSIPRPQSHDFEKHFSVEFVAALLSVFMCLCGCHTVLI